jgi:hypothetical protein
MKLINYSFALVILGLHDFSNAQNTLTQSQIDAIYKTVFEEGQKQDFLKFTKLTSEGEIKSCELEFQKITSDKRNKKEEIHVVKGSLSSHYFKEKFRPITSLKVSPLKLIDENFNSDGVWQIQKPYFATFFYSGTNFNQFKFTENDCETGGICIGYVDDSKFKMTEAITELKNKEMKVIFNFEKGTYDRTIDLSKIEKNFEKIRMDFMQCHMEILDAIRKEIRALK